LRSGASVGVNCGTGCGAWTEVAACTEGRRRARIADAVAVAVYLRSGASVDVNDGAHGSESAEIGTVGDTVAVDVRIAGIAGAVAVEVGLRGIGVVGTIV
jgi:hypothetical protein